MKCPQCGRGNREAAGFCAWCGAALTPQTVSDEPVPDGAAPETVTAGASDAQSATPSAAPAAEPVTTAVAPEGQPNSAPTVGDADEPAAVDASAGSHAAPLPVGALLAGRYEIAELLASMPEQEAGEALAPAGHTYRARDLAACPFCGAHDNAVEESAEARYCAHCGGAIEAGPMVTVVERIERPPTTYDESFEESGRRYYVTVDSTEQVIAPDDAAPALRLSWGNATDKGMTRDQNEDYLETWYYAAGSGAGSSLLLGLFVVADGLGGHEAGEVASRMATESIWQVVRGRAWEPLMHGETLSPEQIDDALLTAVAESNQTVYNSRIERANDMSTTATLALVVNEAVHVANVGDSRAYLWNAAGLRQITKDHSLVQRLVDEGQLTREEVYAHPRRNVIYRSIGDQASVQADLFHHRLAVDDRLILCSDGLWEMVHDDGLEEVLLSEADPQRACQRLVANANLAGGADNISIIIVQAASR